MIFLVLFAILFELEKYAFFKIAFLGQENVHFVLNILFRRWKLFLAFLDFFNYLGFFRRNLFKKKQRTELTGHARAGLLRPGLYKPARAAAPPRSSPMRRG